MPGDTYQQSQGMGQLGAIIGSSFLIMLVISLIILVITIIAWWTIFSKAGYSGALSLFLVFAFGKWPVLREVEMLRQQVAALQHQQAQRMPSSPQYPPYQQHPSSPQYPPYSQYPQG